MQRARNGLVHTSDDEEVLVVPRAPAHMLPPPIEPYHPEPKYTIDTIVTPCTIIPTCYFRIVSIGWDAHEQAHYYNIRSLPRLGEQRQPDFKRTEIEYDLTSFEEMGKLHELSDGDDDEVGELTKNINRITYNTSPDIEIGDEVSVRINSTGEMDKCEWTPGTVVGMHAQYGLWECFIVYYYPGRTMPCTETLLKLVKKGMQSGRKRFSLIDDRVGGPGGGKVRTLKPVLTRQISGYQGPDRFVPPSGICFGDSEKWG